MLLRDELAGEAATAVPSLKAWADTFNNAIAAGDRKTNGEATGRKNDAVGAENDAAGAEDDA